MLLMGTKANGAWETTELYRFNAACAGENCLHWWKMIRIIIDDTYLYGVYTMSVTVKKWGNCLAVRLPKALADSCAIKEGAVMEPEKTANGILLRPSRRRKRTLKEFLAKMKGPNPHGEIDIGGPVGREIL